MIFNYTQRFQSLQEAEKSEQYRFYRNIGYTGDQAVVLACMDLSRPSCGYPAVLQAYEKTDKTETFPAFFVKHAFDKTLVPQDEGIPDPYGRKRPGLFAGITGMKNAGMPMPQVQVSASMPHASLASDAAMGGVNEMKMSMKNVMTASARPVAAGRTQQVSGSVEDVRTDSYEIIEEKGMRDAFTSPTSTFRTTYNTAAASILLSNIRSGSRTRHSMVRTEELLNALSYDLRQPEETVFEITKELSETEEGTLLFLGIQGKKTLPARQNICFLLDVSGSMSGRSDNMLMSVFSVLSKMNNGDVFSLVTYSGSDKVVINGLKLQKEKDIDAILYMLVKEVFISGCTNGSAGLNKAYDLIGQNRIENGVNRVIILTDGDLNFGVHEKDGLKGLIAKKRETGAYFSAIGTGIYNLMDDKLETLAKNGNGNYFVVNSREDIEKDILGKYESLVFPIAKNVKAQVEFNPAVVSRYQLVGYENRTLDHEEFRDDSVIAEPFGSGSYCVAVYRLELSGPRENAGNLKYQRAVLTDSDELCTVTLRYQTVDTGEFLEESFPVEKDPGKSANIDKAASCIRLAEKLRADNIDELTRTRFLDLMKQG